MPRAKTKPNDIMQSNRDAPQGNAAARKQKYRIPPFGRILDVSQTARAAQPACVKVTEAESKRIRAVDNARAAQPSFAVFMAAESDAQRKDARTARAAQPSFAVFTAAESGACLQASA
jgi:hypothetical protein